MNLHLPQKLCLRSSQFLLLGLALSLGFSSLKLTAQPLETPQTDNTLTHSHSGIHFKPNPDPPPTNSSGGTRPMSFCNQELSLVSNLLPPESSQELTLQEYPTFYVYLPLHHLETASLFLEIVHSDQSTEDFYFTESLPLPQEEGIVGFALPQDAPPLEDNITYRWFLGFECEDEMTFVTIQGEITKRPSLSRNLSLSPSLALAYDYAQQGLWYDTLDVLIQLRKQEADNPQYEQDWNQLLQQGFLDHERVDPYILEVYQKLLDAPLL